MGSKQCAYCCKHLLTCSCIWPTLLRASLARRSNRTMLWRRWGTSRSASTLLTQPFFTAERRRYFMCRLDWWLHPLTHSTCAMTIAGRARCGLGSRSVGFITCIHTSCMMSALDLRLSPELATREFTHKHHRASRVAIVIIRHVFWLEKECMTLSCQALVC